MEITIGRRASDKWLAAILQGALTQRPVYTDEQRNAITPYIKIEDVKQRRPRRTKKQLRAALAKAVGIVKQTHPDWESKRILRSARTLVRLYKVV